VAERKSLNNFVNMKKPHQKPGIGGRIMGLKETEWKDVDWIHLGQDRN
jgi:hypothetical protein